MKRYAVILFIIFSALLVSSCSKRNAYLNTDLTNERWASQVDTNPNKWTRGADRWFLTGDPNSVELANRNSPYSSAVSTMMVRVPNFTNIRTNGDFQVQIFGTYNNNSVYVFGPNNAVRAVSVEVHGNTLSIMQAKDAPRNVDRVIVRIGIRQLNNLTQMGCGTIEGIQIQSNSLCITTTPSAGGNIYLAGHMRVRRINHAGQSSVSVFGADTSDLEIKTTGSGSVNVSGNVGLRSIVHHGSANINIIGACSMSGGAATIFADGKGKIGINGPVNIRKITACDSTCVYAYPVNSNSIYAYAYKKARIGLAGSTNSLFVDTNDKSRFLGRYLCAQEAFVRAHDSSHVNVTASNKIFASATGNSSIYFYGSPNVMSQFISGDGVVIPIWGPGAGGMCYAAPRRVYKGESVARYK